MSKQIIWSIKAKTELLKVLEYRIERNGSNTFAKKLNELIEEDLKLLSEYPDIGRETDIPAVRVRVIQKYLLYYEFNKEAIFILTFRHQKRNPNTL